MLTARNHLGRASFLCQSHSLSLCQNPRGRRSSRDGRTLNRKHRSHDQLCSANSGHRQRAPSIFQIPIAVARAALQLSTRHFLTTSNAFHGREQRWSPRRMRQETTRKNGKIHEMPTDPKKSARHKSWRSCGSSSQMCTHSWWIDGH